MKKGKFGPPHLPPILWNHSRKGSPSDEENPLPNLYQEIVFFENKYKRLKSALQLGYQLQKFVVLLLHLARKRKQVLSVRDTRALLV